VNETQRIDELARIMEREAMMPLRYPAAWVPRWKQVATRVLESVPIADSRWQIVVEAACQAYLGDY